MLLAAAERQKAMKYSDIPPANAPKTAPRAVGRPVRRVMIITIKGAAPAITRGTPTLMPSGISCAAISMPIFTPKSFE